MRTLDRSSTGCVTHFFTLSSTHFPFYFMFSFYTVCISFLSVRCHFLGVLQQHLFCNILDIFSITFSFFSCILDIDNDFLTCDDISIRFLSCVSNTPYECLNLANQKSRKLGVFGRK